MWVWSLDREDPLEEGMATHSSILAQRIPWTEEPWGLQSIASHRVGQDWSNLAGMHARYLDSWNIQPPSGQIRCSTLWSFHQPSSILHIPVLLYSMYEKHHHRSTDLWFSSFHEWSQGNSIYTVSFTPKSTLKKVYYYCLLMFSKCIE